MTSLLLGQLTLNLSFVLYLFVYLPQIIHNHKKKQLHALSLGMHFILFSAYLLDLMYGFLNHYPWQYKLVSCVGVFLMLVQHVQLAVFLWKKNDFLWFGVCFLALFVATIVILLGFMFVDFFRAEVCWVLGWCSRVFFLSYIIPQLIKNIKLNSASAVSLYFVFLSLILSCLDTLSAWCLDWGWPNKLGSPISILLMGFLLYQIKQEKNYFRSFCI